MHTPVHPPHNHHFPNRFPVLILRPVEACRNVFHNQSTIDGLNAILAGCDKLRVEGKVNCNAAFINSVEKQLTHEISIARLVGTNCAKPTIY